MEVVAISGDVRYGGSSFRSFTDEKTNSSGEVVFRTFGDVWHWNKSDGLQSLAKAGQHFPGLDPVDSILRFDSPSPFLSDDGIVAIKATTQLQTSSIQGWTTTREGNTQIVAQIGANALGLGGDLHFSGFPVFELTQSGLVGVMAEFSSPSTQDEGSGIWAQVEVGGPLQLVAASGQIAPGTEYPFDDFVWNYFMNRHGDVSFVTRVQTEPGMPGNREYGLWFKPREGSLRHIVSEGQTLAGEVIVSPRHGLVFDDQRIVFESTLDGPIVDGAATVGTFLIEPGGATELLLKTNADAPVLAGDEKLRAFDVPILLNNGDIRFSAWLTGSAALSEKTCGN